MNWEFMSFDLRLPVDTHLFTIKEELTRRHGLLRDLVICKDSFAEQNELQDDTATLKDFGVVGAQASEDPVEITLYYEFKPASYDDPLLLHKY